MPDKRPILLRPMVAQTPGAQHTSEFLFELAKLGPRFGLGLHARQYDGEARWLFFFRFGGHSRRT